MRQSDERFEREKERSRQWEIWVANARRRLGEYVIPTYDFSGKDDNKAPKLLAPPGTKDLVLPDLQCFTRKAGKRWLEVKVKTCADLHRKTGHIVTGINTRHYDDYRRVQEITGDPVGIVFIHESEAEIRADLVDRLRKYEHHRYEGRKMGRGGMVFWEYRRLPLIRRLPGVAA